MREPRYPRPWFAIVSVMCTVALAAPLGAAADSGISISLGAATPAASPAGGVVDASGVTLSDGRTLLTYWHPVAAGLALSASVVEASGAVVAAPVELNVSSNGVLPTALAKDGAGHAAVLWVDGTQAIVSYFDGSSFSALSALDLHGLDAATCLLGGAAAAFIVACDSTDPLVPGDAVQVRVGWLVPGSLAPSWPLALVPPTAQGNHLAALGLDGAGRAWVAYTTPTPASLGRVDLYLAALDQGGNVSLAPSALISATNKTVRVSIAASATNADGADVAFTEVENLEANVEVRVRQFSTRTSSPPPPALLSSSPAVVDGLALVARNVDGSNLLLVEWAEDRLADRDLTSGAAHPRPVLAALAENLSILLPPAAQAPMAGQSAGFVAGGGDLMEFGPPLLIHRVTVAVLSQGSPSSVPPPANSLLVVAVVIALAVGSGSVALASFSDRFKWALFVAVWPLYVALRRDKALLDNMRRGAILQVVSESPGVRFTDLSRRTGISSGALRYHLSVLEEFGFVARAANRNAVRLYPAGKNPIHEEPFKAIRDQIIGEILKAPGLSHTELARKVGVKWSTLLYHAEILEETGAIQTKFEGRTRRYWANENR